MWQHSHAQSLSIQVLSHKLSRTEAGIGTVRGSTLRKKMMRVAMSVSADNSFNFMLPVEETTNSFQEIRKSLSDLPITKPHPLTLPTP